MVRPIASLAFGIVSSVGLIGTGMVAVAFAQEAAPQAQRSLFPQGQCGGIFCSAVGGSQAPAPPPYAPPPCGGGLLCSLDPYGSGVPMTASEVARIQAERARAEAVAQPSLPKMARAHRRNTKAKRKVASGNK